MYAGASLAPQRSLLLSPPTTAYVIAISLHPPLPSFSRSSLRSPSPKLRFRSPAPSSINPSFRPRSKWESEGVWEDPDDGYGSEYEERGGLEEEDDDEVEEEEEDAGGEARGAKPSHLGVAKSPIAQFDEELVKGFVILRVF